MELKKDVLGREPIVGDIIGFNPAKYKGLRYGKCVGFSKAGLPEIDVDRDLYDGYIGQRNSSGYYTPKTGFLICRSLDDGNNSD